MIERIRGKDPLSFYNKCNYKDFVRSKNILDILHQIQVAGMKDTKMQKELNIYFRSAIESILLHVDCTGENDLKFNELD